MDDATGDVKFAFRHPVLRFLGERLGSGDGERKTLLTRQIAFEPLPASVLLALGWPVIVIKGVWDRWMIEK